MRATTATIADRAGISLRSVFRYYNDLPGLLTAALDEYHHRLGPWTLPPPPPGIPLTERIVVIAEHHTNGPSCVWPWPPPSTPTTSTVSATTTHAPSNKPKPSSRSS